MKGFARHIVQKLWIITVLSFLFFSFLSCKKNEVYHPQKTEVGSALEKIQKKGKLEVISDYNSTSYFLYRGTPMGFNYEVLRAFADHLGVQLNIGLAGDLDKTYISLADGSVDMIAVELPASQEKNHIVNYTDHIFYSCPVLVQRKSTGREENRQLVRDTEKLGGKVVYVEKGSPFVKILTMLSIEVKNSIEIIEHPDLKTEQLISAVAHGQIDYTVAFEPVAIVNMKYHNNLDISTVLSHGQNLVWMVSQDSEDLLIAFNEWLSGFRKSKKFSILYEKYYLSERTVRIVGSDLYSVKGGKISAYDQSIRKYSRLINWDWRLLASVIYKESRFQPDAQAWSGAYGLMQLMPDVAEKYGIDSLSVPAKQIEAGVKYLESLDKQFRNLVKDKDERVKFVLAAYNVGLGHVLDARRLALKYGKQNDVWTNNVDSFLLKKAEPRFYQDRVAYYGYCRGEEPFAFVNDIMEIYQLYRNAIQN